MKGHANNMSPLAGNPTAAWIRGGHCYSLAAVGHIWTSKKITPGGVDSPGVFSCVSSRNGLAVADFTDH